MGLFMRKEGEGSGNWNLSMFIRNPVGTHSRVYIILGSQ